MDRRLFLKSVGTTAGIAAASTETFAASSVLSPSPQFLSAPNRDRLKITSTLAPWVPSASQPWDVHTINHLYRRAGFGATLAEMSATQVKTPSQVIDALLDDTLLSGSKLPGDPRYSNTWLHVQPYLGSDQAQLQKELSDYYTANMEIRRHWTVQMSLPDVMLREKMTLFWMNHFVVEAKKVYFPQTMYNFLMYMRQNAWGNFKQMVKDITIMPAMLYYLDGILNQGLSPNENYARELQELFQMGVTDKNGNANYTQDDVEAIAHALTGWTVDVTAPAPNVLPSKYNINLHDSSFQKVYDGIKRQYNLTASGAPMDMDLIDHIFDQRGDQIAWFICSKLYQYFVYHEITTDAEKAIVQQLADTLKVNWSIKDVLSLLLKSEHFFDEANIGAAIKSPYDHLIGIIRTFNIPIEELASGTLYYYALAGSQELLDPPNVKGWPGYHAWISTTTLPFRNTDIGTQLLITKMLAAIGSDGYGNNHIPEVLSDDMITAWGKQFANYSGTFDDLLTEMAKYLCAQPPTATALQYIKGGLPPNTYEWASLTDAEKIIGLRLMTTAIMLLADYQLY